MPRRERSFGGLWGAVVGDALGVPIEFKSWAAIAQVPVTEMRGYGTHQQPPGTWSDDSSLLLCTAESLLNGFDLQDLGRRFVRWLDERYWTPWGQVFDVGITTREAIRRIAQGGAPEQAGSSSEQSNGNGSLMRILPVALRYAGAPAPELAQYAHRASCLTHRHPRSQMACGLYCLLVAALLHGASPGEAYQEAIHQAQAIYQQPPFDDEARHFARLFSGQMAQIPEADISTKGYIIATLEASVWCLLNTGAFEEAVLKAVNLGGDTDPNPMYGSMSIMVSRLEK